MATASDRANLLVMDAERPSLETREWAVYWDSEQRDWYYHDKIRGEQKLQQHQEVLGLQ